MDQRSEACHGVVCEDKHQQVIDEPNLILKLCWIKRLSVCINKVCFKKQSVLYSCIDIRVSVELC